jgi:uncharacterized membrane protein
MAKTSIGLDENLTGALCYLVLWITGIVFYLLEKDNKFVKFHAMQSILVFLPLTIIGFFLSIIWFLWWLGWLIWLLSVILWLVLMIKAYQGEKFKLPIVGDIAEKQI